MMHKTCNKQKFSQLFVPYIQHFIHFFRNSSHTGSIEKNSIVYLQLGKIAVLDFYEDTGYPHDGRANKDSYLHDGRVDKDSYPHDGRSARRSCRLIKIII